MGKGLWIGLGLFCTAAAVSVYGLYRLATRYYDFGAASGELPQAVADYRRAGLPWLASELVPKSAKPNAAPAIRAAIKAMPPKPAAIRLAAQLKKSDSGADSLLSGAYRVPLDFVGEAMDRPRADFGRDWDFGTFVLFPEYATMKTLAKAAVLRAVRAAEKGDDVAALHDLALARRLGLWAGGEPTLISMLVRLAIEAIALDGAERCLALVAQRPERIARYAAWLKKAPPLPRFEDALRGEAFLGVTTMRNLGSIGGIQTVTDPNGEGYTQKIDPARLRRDGLPDDTKSRGFLARHLQLWTEAYRMTDGFTLPPEAIGRRLDAIEKRLDREKGLSYVLERILFPVFSQASTAVVNLQAKRAVEAGFAEALTTHALTGRWPTRVAGTDPFTGGSLGVKHGPKGFRVWSVGRDRKDDGGLLRREAPKRQGATFDEVAVYPPVPR